MDIIKCPNCGSAVVTGEKFCSECGYDLRMNNTQRKEAESKVADLNAGDAERTKKEEYFNSANQKIQAHIKNSQKTFTVVNTIAAILLVGWIIFFFIGAIVLFNDTEKAPPLWFFRTLSLLPILIGVISVTSIASYRNKYIAATNKIQIDNIDASKLLHYAINDDYEFSKYKSEEEMLINMEKYLASSPALAEKLAKNQGKIINGKYLEKCQTYYASLLYLKKENLQTFSKNNIIKMAVATIVAVLFCALTFLAGTLFAELLAFGNTLSNEEAAMIAKGYLPRAIAFGSACIAGIIAYVITKKQVEKVLHQQQIYYLKELKEQKTSGEDKEEVDITDML